MVWNGYATRVLGVALLLTTLAGCTSSEPVPPSRSSTPQVSRTPYGGPTPSENAALRARLVTSLAATDEWRARLVQTGQLTVVPAQWLVGWQIIDVVNNTLPHPQRFYLALSADGTVFFLTGHPADFNRTIAAADLYVTSAKVATEVAVTFLDSTRDFVKYSYRIDELDDITWLPKLDQAATQVRAGVEAKYGQQVARPQARKSGHGWRVSVWMVNGNRLIRHDLSVASDGAVTDDAKTMFVGLPVPDSL